MIFSDIEAVKDSVERPLKCERILGNEKQLEEVLSSSEKKPTHIVDLSFYKSEITEEDLAAAEHIT